MTYQSLFNELKRYGVKGLSILVTDVIPSKKVRTFCGSCHGLYVIRELRTVTSRFVDARTGERLRVDLPTLRHVYIPTDILTPSLSDIIPTK